MKRDHPGDERAASLRRLLPRIPFTMVMVTGIFTASAAAGLLGHSISPEQLQRWGFGLQDLLAGRFWKLALAPFFIIHPYMALSITSILVFFLGTCELVLRTRRALIAFWTAHVSGYVGAFALLDLLGHLGLRAARSLSQETDVGASNGAFGAAGAVLHFLPGSLRRGAFALIGIYLLGSFSMGHRIWDVEHILSFSWGLGLGWVYSRRDGRQLEGLLFPLRLGRRQRPIIVGWLVAGMGLVNVCAAFLLPHHPGMLRLESWLPLGNPHAPRHLLLVSGLFLLVLSRGLRRGDRQAWWGAFFALFASILLQLDLGLTKLEALLALAFLILLLSWKEDFQAEPDMPRVSLGLRWLRNLLLGVPLVGFFGVLALHPQFRSLPSIPELLGDILRRMFYMNAQHLVPVGHRGKWLLEAIPLVWWGGILLSLLQVVRAARAPKPQRADRQRARDLVLEFGRTGTAYMTLRTGNSYFFGARGHTVLAYRVHAETAVVLGDVIGPFDAWRETLEEFAQYCEKQAWRIALFAVSENMRPSCEAAGLRLLQIGEEAVLPLEGLEFKGKSWQNMRSALNRAKRDGISFELYEGGSVPPEIEEQLFAISAEWQEAQKLPPMEFTLGRTEDVRDPQIDVGVAFDATGRVHAFVDWLPVPAQRGWVIDLMRRRHDAMSNVMEFLIGMSLLVFQQRGDRFASLAAAPLADLDREDDERLLPRVLGAIYENFGTFYDFKSLFDFKERFRPRWEPVYLAYRDEAQLPAIAMAIVRAHLPNLDAAGLARILGANLVERLPLVRGAAPK